MAFGCKSADPHEQVQATYDSPTGKLSQLTVNGARDGKPNVTSHMSGTKFISIEIDADEDGKIDRWEYYDAAQRIERVGISRSNDGTQDAWLIPAVDGSIARIDVSTRRNGKPNRQEFYEKGALIRVQEDTDGDGRVDKWEQYESGALVSVSFDTVGSGKPTTTIDYRK